MDGVEPLEAIQARFDRDGVTLDPSTCLRTAVGRACDACVEACRAGLPFRDGDAYLSEDARTSCSACGACVSACPMGAVRRPPGLQASIRELLASARQRTRTVLTCAAHPDPSGEDMVDIGCLHAVSDGVLFALAGSEDGTTMLAPGDCAGCGIAPASRSLLLTRIEYVGAVLRSMGAPGVLRLDPDRTSFTRPGHAADPRVTEPADRSVPIGRREAFGMVARDVLSLVRDLAPTGEAPTGEAPSTGPPEPPARGGTSDNLDRLLFVRTLRSLEQAGVLRLEARNPEPGALSTLGPRVSAERCIGCGDCARLCPTGALVLRDTDDSWCLGLRPDRCVGCGTCAALCRVDAIDMVARPVRRLLGNPLRLLSLEHAICETCGAGYGVSHGDTEPVKDARSTGRDVPVNAVPVNDVRARKLCPPCAARERRFSGFY